VTCDLQGTLEIEP